MNGYIKLFRQIRDNWIWHNPEYLRAWIDLLLSAAHDDYKTIYKGEVRVIHKGTVHRSLSSLAESWGWSRKRVRHFIKLLEMDEMVTTRVSTNDTVLTIANWDFFQDENGKRDNEGTNEGINEGANEGTTNKKVKKVKNKYISRARGFNDFAQRDDDLNEIITEMIRKEAQ